ncbi:MAG: hypothetical protein HDT02_03575 [Bacteroidales bacterium]|nr:hypothetical protein [Bacteroidales bacterium]
MSDYSCFANYFPGITQIFVFNPDKLPAHFVEYALLLPDYCPFVSGDDIRLLPIAPGASLISTSVFDSSGYHGTSELSFSVVPETEIPDGYAFLVIDANASHWVIGNKLPLRPNVSREHSNQDPSKGRSDKITVSWGVPPVRCRFLFS